MPSGQYSIHGVFELTLLNMMSHKELKDCIKILRDRLTEAVFEYGYYHEQTEEASKRLEFYKREYERRMNDKD